MITVAQNLRNGQWSRWRPLGAGSGAADVGPPIAGTISLGNVGAEPAVDAESHGHTVEIPGYGSAATKGIAKTDPRNRQALGVK
jgi:hypothetical protein